MKHFFLISDYKRGSGKNAGNGASLYVPANVVKIANVHERNINEGSEFLDDNIRMNDRQTGNTGADMSASGNDLRQ